jgi:hypothetical protein
VSHAWERWGRRGDTETGTIANQPIAELTQRGETPGGKLKELIGLNKLNLNELKR